MTLNFAIVIKDGLTISPIFRVIPDPDKLNLKKEKRINGEIQFVDDKNIIKLKNKLLTKFVKPNWKYVYVEGLGKKIDIKNNHWDDSKQQIINSPYIFTSEDLNKVKQKILSMRIADKEKEWYAAAILASQNPEAYKLTKAQAELTDINNNIDSLKWQYLKIL